VPALERYLVELHRPVGGWRDLQGVAARARAAAGQVREDGQVVRLLRTIFVPEDDSCFFLYEGSSAEAVVEAGQRAAVAIGRVAEAVHVEARPRGGSEWFD
jgi:hypothetical protein